MNGGQVLITLIALFVLGGAAVGVLALSGDDDASPQTSAAPPTIAVTATVTQPPAAPTEEPQSSPTAERAASTQLLPDRDSCGEIRGTDYRSTAEREFFLGNCVNQETAGPAGTIANPPSVSTDTSIDCTASVEIVTSRADQTYEVTGTNIDEIANSLDANAPKTDDGTAYGLTEYSYGLDGSFCVSVSGSCGLGEITITADVVVILPNLITLDQIIGDVLDTWTIYADQVEVHENRHVRILEEGLETIKSNLLSLDSEPDCDRLNHEIDKVWTFGGGQIEQRQRAFHAADSRGQGGLVVQ